MLKFCAVSSGLINPQIQKNVGSVKSTNVIYGRTQRHDCDTENKPVIGRMQALSSTDSDIFWVHKPNLSFWLWLEKYLVNMDSHFGRLIQFNFVPWLLTHFACDNIDINDSNLDGENISMLRAEQMILKPSINLSFHVGSTCDALHAGSTGDLRFYSGWRNFG